MCEHDYDIIFFTFGEEKNGLHYFTVYCFTAICINSEY